MEYRAERETKADSSLYQNEFAHSFWSTELGKKNVNKKEDPLVQLEDKYNETRYWDAVELQDLGSEDQSEPAVQ